MKTNYYPLITDSLIKIETHLAAAINSILEKWTDGKASVKNSAILVFSETPVDQNSFENLSHYRSDESGLSISFPKQAVIQAMELPNQSDSLSSKITASIMSEFIDDIYYQLLNSSIGDIQEVERIDTSDFDRNVFSSPVIVKLDCILFNMLFVLDREYIETIAPYVPAKKSIETLPQLSNSLVEQTLELELKVGSVESNASSIRKLQVGDVFVLDSKANEPMTLVIGEQEVGHAFLGKTQGHKAIVIAE